MNRGGPDLQASGSLRFAPQRRPVFRPSPGGRGAETIDPDCCDVAECPQRDVNRALAVIFERLSQAYAAWWLLQEGVGRVWETDHEGHTVQCPDPKCEFGRRLQGQLEMDREALEVAAIRLFRTITEYAAFDIEGEWAAFTGTEIAGRTALEPPSERARMVSLEALKQEVAGFDPLEYQRWFKPPGAGGRAS